MKNIIAQIFGIGAMIALFSIYQQTERKKLITAKLCADVCWVIHYLCLGAVGGAIPNFVGIFRELVFVNRKDKNRADKIIWPVAFIAVNLILGIITMKSYINLLPITASVFVTVSLWLKNPTLTKIISFPVSVSFLIYDCFVHSWVGVINESLSLISILIAMIKIIKLKKGTEANELPRK
ncbi:MAG: YgjV family protein [Acutalibacteraceae bacterium]|nr:YgjV family protein [Acutalibacteraceae bacterium]